MGEHGNACRVAALLLTGRRDVAVVSGRRTVERQDLALEVLGQN